LKGMKRDHRRPRERERVEEGREIQERRALFRRLGREVRPPWWSVAVASLLEVFVERS